MLSKTPITICAPTWHKSASYGRMACETRDYLTKKGYFVNTVGQQVPQKRFYPSSKTIFMGYPTNHQNYGPFFKFGHKISSCMFESDEIPFQWVDPLNSCERVIVPCKWNKEVFEGSGVKVPIHVIPLGVSDAFHYVERQEKEVFRFITIGDRGHRKGFTDAIMAFVRAFGKRTDVELIVKSRSPLGELSNPNIKIITDDYTDEQMQRLYAKADCMLFPAHGEGFALPPREFAVTGGISLCTNYGGMADEIEHWGIGLKYELVPAWAFPPPSMQHFRHLGRWADCDLDDLVDKMLWVRNLDFNDRIRMGSEFSRYARTYYSWQNYGDSLLELLELKKELEHGNVGTA